MSRGILVGCAGWSLPKSSRRRFPQAASQLERYAARLPGVEINSSFYRPHLPQTYARWGASVPETFRFCVKIPKEITHRLRLKRAGPALRAFLREVAELRRRLGCLLLQLPPSLAFEPRVAQGFLRTLRKLHGGNVVVEPRHASWFTPAAESSLRRFRIGRVAADPPRAPGDGDPGGWPGVVYYRLHGSPKIYFSSYGPAYLRKLAARLDAHVAAAETVWCIFDNTALGAATANALALLRALHPRKPRGRPAGRPSGRPRKTSRGGKSPPR